MIRFAGRLFRALVRRTESARRRLIGLAIRHLAVPLFFRRYLVAHVAYGCRRPKFLVLRFRYRNGKPALGESQGEENLSESIRSTDIADLVEYCYDIEGGGGLTAERNLIRTIDEQRPNLIILSSYDVFGSRFPHFEAIKAVRRHCHIPVVSVWWDSTSEFARQQLAAMGGDVDLNIMIESGRLAAGYPDPRRFLQLWAPIDHRAFIPAGGARDIPISFVGAIGSYRGVRKEYLDYLSEHGVPVLIGGADPHNMLPLAQFVDIIGRSRISLNFSHSVEGTHQMKGRVLEVMFCGALLFESRNSETPKFFVPGVHYIEFESRQDLLDKAHYYLTHENELAAIAARGRDWALTRYTHDAFWRETMARLCELGAIQDSHRGSQN